MPETPRRHREPSKLEASEQFADTSRMKHRRQAAVALAALAVAVAGALAVGHFTAAEATSRLPNVRGNIPTGDSYNDTEWVKPLLDAGYCVRFRFDAKGGPIQVEGGWMGIADSYYIFDENLDSDSDGRPTVVVIVSGSPLGGPTVDWNSMRPVCPLTAS